MTEELRPLARETYFRAREQPGVLHWRAMAAILPMLVHHLNQRQNDAAHGVQGAVLATAPNQQEIEQWAAEEAWEQQFDLMQQDSFRANLRAPEDEEDRFRLRLDTYQQSVDLAADALREIQDEQKMPGFVFSDLYIQKLDRARRYYNACCTDLEKLEDQARLRLLEATGGAVARAAIEAKKQRLLRQYGDLGPQYEIVCGLLAGLEYQQEQSQLSGRQIPIPELVSLNKSILDTVATLQRYTESTKSESLTRDRNELGLALMLIMEKHFALQQPQQWARALAEVKGRLGAPGEPTPIRPLHTIEGTVVD